MTRRIRIAVLTTVHPRFDARIYIKEVRTLAASLPADVDYIVADGLGPATDLAENVTIHDVGKPAGGRLLRALKGPYRAYRKVRVCKPDVVHFHDPELMPLAFLLKSMGFRIVYDVHEDVPRQLQSKAWIPRPIRLPMAWAVSAMEWAGARAFDTVIAATPKIAARFPGHKTAVVQNFPIPSELQTSRIRKTPGGDAMFAYIGGLARPRGCAEIVDAIAHLNMTHSAQLMMAGNFIPASFESDLRELAGWRYVKYLGYLPREGVRDTLSCAVAGLVTLYPEPNYIDSFPVKLFEYMAAGLPVIASDFPLWRKIINGAGCGLLADPMNPRSIANQMQWILDNPNEAAAMGARGRAAIETVYNWDSEAQKLLQAYAPFVRHCQ